MMGRGALEQPGHAWGLLALAAAAVCLGSSHVVEKVAIARGAAPAGVAVLRGGTALAMVAAGWLVLNRAALRAALPAPRMLPHVALIGVLASGLVVTLALLALRHTSATHKGVIQALYPLATAAFAVVLLGERLTARALGALMAVTAGLAVVLSRGLAGPPNAGDWMLLATVPVVGFSDAWARRTLQGVSPLTLAAGRQLFGWLFLWAALALAGLSDPREALVAWHWVAAAGLLAGGFVYLFYVGIERSGATTAATVLAGAPVVTAALEYVLRGERLGVGELAGLIVILAGIPIVARETR